jgi:hypothetical protein
MKKYTMEEAEIIISTLRKQAKELKTIVYDDPYKQTMARELTKFEPALWAVLQGIDTIYNRFDKFIENHKDNGRPE